VSWWQIVLIILGSIIVGVLVGYLLYYLIVIIAARLRKKPTDIPANEPQATAVVPEPPKAQVPEPPKIKIPEPSKVKVSELPRAKVPEPPKTKIPEPPPKKVPEPSKTAVPDLFLEIESNRRIASQTWTGDLQSFQTQAWDNKGDEVHSLPPEVREELTQAYFDMSLANSVVWLATEMGRRSPSLDESYLKLRSTIADRLNRVKSPIEQLRLGQS